MTKRWETENRKMTAYDYARVSKQYYMFTTQRRLSGKILLLKTNMKSFISLVPVQWVKVKSAYLNPQST